MCLSLWGYNRVCKVTPVILHGVACIPRLFPLSLPLPFTTRRSPFLLSPITLRAAPLPPLLKTVGVYCAPVIPTQVIHRIPCLIEEFERFVLPLEETEGNAAVPRS